MISKSEEIDIVKLFPELDGSILYTPLTMVKQMIEIAKDSLLAHYNQPQRHLVVLMLFSQLETLVRLLLTIYHACRSADAERSFSGLLVI